MSSPLYNRDILRLAASIPHLGRLEAPQARVERTSPICGSRVAVDVRLDRQGRVAELAQEVRACALGQAAACLMGTHALGRSVEQLAQARDSLAAYLDGSRAEPGTWPGIGILAAARPYSARHA
ncbi:MAG TPA: iron-sulfur cluster assembly scaffold protein, partial [Allosphingosinicella sp.]